jgi:hypothetical protein
MKSFKDYLVESQSEKKYTFKVKIAGAVPDHCEDVMEVCLQKYKVSKLVKGKSSPIQSKLMDFPNLENESVTVFDVDLEYPTTSQVVAACISEHVGVTLDRIKVRSTLEEEEAEMNSESVDTTDKKEPPLLRSSYKKENNQELVGDKRVSSFMKELAKVNKEHKLEQYKGVNDAILAKTAPKGKEK